MNTSLAFWAWRTIAPQIRPNRSLGESKKDESYHVDCARYYLGSQRGSCYDSFRYQYAVNMAFLKGLWGLPEDAETYLKDSFGNTTSRKALEQNIISPMVNRLKGGARNLSISAEAEAITQLVTTRWETSLGKALLMAQAAQLSTEMGAMMGDMYGVSPDEAETEQRVENTYQDGLVKGINSMLSMLAVMNSYDTRKSEYAEKLALSGLCAAIASLEGEHITWNPIEPEDVVWDTQCKRPDFSDASFIAVCPQMDISDIAERWTVSQSVLEEMERVVNATTLTGVGNTWPDAKPRVFTVYWRDARYVERGYVMKDGVPHFCTINEPDPDREDKKPKYTTADVIDPPENVLDIKYFKGKKTRRVAVEVVRYCSFIPREFMPVGWTFKAEGAKTADLVLDYGLYPLQEEDPAFAGGVKFPIKCSAWSYLNGDVLAPVSYAVSPQRFVNQMTSGIIWYLAKAGGKNTAIDGRSINPEYMDESEVNIAMKEGDPIFLDGRGQGINQAVGTYDNSPNASLMHMFSMLQQGVAMGQASTAISDTAQGQPLDKKQLVGTTELLLQQTNIVNMPFYGAIIDFFEQQQQFNAQVGKQYYARNEDALRQLVGDEAAVTFMLDPDAPNEMYRVGIKVQLDEEARRQEAQQLIMGLMAPPYQALDATTAGELMSSGAFPEDVWRAVAKLGRQKEEAMKAQAQAQQQAAQAQLLQAEQDRMDEKTTQFNQELARASESADKSQAKLMQPYAQGQADQMFPEPADKEVGVSIGK